MTESFKNFLAGAVGIVLLFSFVLTAVLGFLYVRDGMTTALPALLIGSATVLFITLILTWCFRRIREWLSTEIFSWLLLP